MMIVVILLSSIRLITSVVGFWVVMLLNEAPATAKESAEIWIAHAFLTIPTEILIVWSAWTNIRRRPAEPAYWASLVITSLWAIVTSLIAVGVIPAPLWYQRQPSARALVFQVIGLTFFAQSIAWCIADRQRFVASSESHQRRRLKQVLLAFAAIAVIALSSWKMFIGTSSLSDRPAVVNDFE